MRTAAICLASILACSCAAPTTEAPRAGEPAPARVDALTLERLLSRPSLTGTQPSAPLWSPDSRRLAFSWSDDPNARREVWLVDADGNGLRRLTAAEGPAVRWFAWTPDGQALVCAHGDTLWRTELDGRTARLTELGGGTDELALSPDGRSVSFLRDGDLWVLEIEDAAIEATARRLTHVGVPSISKLPLGRYRRPEVEIGPYVWGGPSYAWSPDGSVIAVHHVDRRMLRQVPFPHYLGEETEPNFVRRGYPGDPNEARSVGIVHVASGELRLLPLPEPTAMRVVDFAWSAHGELLIDRESDTCAERELWLLDPERAPAASQEAKPAGAQRGDPRLLWRDRRDTRVYTTVGSAWHPDGEHVIALADLGDRYGLYALHRDRPEPRLLSDPRFDVTSGPTITANGAICYTANEPRPSEQHACVTTLDGAPRRLTRLAGESRPAPSPDGRHLAVLHSDDTTPTELYVLPTDGSGGERRVTWSTPPEFRARAWAKARYVTFASHVDGATLHAHVLEPVDLDRSRRHPVLFGPVYSNTVRDRWAGFWALFQQLLVDRGYIVVQVDVRGSTGYGRAFREAFLGDFAGRDLDDLESAVRHVETLPWVDPERIGVFGSSYGGTLTVYALLKKPGLFDAGVACAAAVDPHFFGSDDVAIVRQPQTHPEAFLRGAAQFAANLEDPLLLIHGMQDQVVPFKTVVDLAEALMRAGKDFDFAFAPAGTHGWTSPPHYARHLLGKLLQHFDRHLRAGEAAR